MYTNYLYLSLCFASYLSQKAILTYSAFAMIILVPWDTYVWRVERGKKMFWVHRHYHHACMIADSWFCFISYAIHDVINLCGILPFVKAIMPLHTLSTGYKHAHIQGLYFK